MTKKDQEVLAEAYGEIQEGLMDVIRSRGSQAAGALRGAGDRVKGAAQTAAGKAVGAIGRGIQKGAERVYEDPGKLADPANNKLLKKGAEMQKAGAEKTASGKASGEKAKYESYLANSAKTIAKDLSSLGMSVSDEAALIKDIQATISKHLVDAPQS
jgi:hypothetical protein